MQVGFSSFVVDDVILCEASEKVQMDKHSWNSSDAIFVDDTKLKTDDDNNEDAIIKLMTCTFFWNIFVPCSSFVLPLGFFFWAFIRRSLLYAFGRLYVRVCCVLLGVCF